MVSNHVERRKITNYIFQTIMYYKMQTKKGIILNLPCNVQIVADQLPQSTRDVNLMSVK